MDESEYFIGRLHNAESEIYEMKHELMHLKSNSDSRGARRFIDEVSKIKICGYGVMIVLLFFTAINVSLFFGGAIYTNIQVASIQEKYDEAQSRIREAKEEFSKASDEYKKSVEHSKKLAEKVNQIYKDFV